jgi:hypothetical protein
MMTKRRPVSYWTCKTAIVTSVGNHQQMQLRKETWYVPSGRIVIPAHAEWTPSRMPPLEVLFQMSKRKQRIGFQH